VMAKQKALHFTDKQIDAQSMPDDAAVEKAQELVTISPLLASLLNAEPME
jgi:hypothetical protein